MMPDMWEQSQRIGEEQPTIQSLLEQGKKKEAWAIVEGLRDEGIEFDPGRFEEIKKDFFSDSKQWKWGQWGPKDDLVGNAVLTVEDSFLQNAGMLMSTKGLQHGRNEAAKQLEVQGALYSAFEDDVMCPLCSSMDGLECRVPSEEFDRYSPPQHCFCRCMWVYVNKEEEGWKPDDDWEGEITKRSGGVPPDDLIDKHGHANSSWEKSGKKGDNEAGVTYRTMEREAKKAFSAKREKPPETETSGGGSDKKPPATGGGGELPMDDEEFKKFSDSNKDEMRHWLQSDHWQKWHNGLSENERTALEIYQGGDSYKINKFLRNSEPLSKDLQKAIKDLDAAIERGFIPENIISYRGFTDSELSGIIKLIGEENAKGLVHTDLGFMSTSLSYDYCNSKKSSAQKIMMELKIRKGLSGATMTSNDIGEYEVLLGRKRSIVINDVKTKDGILFINGEVF